MTQRFHLALPRGLGKAKLQKLYGNQFRGNLWPNCNLHHLTPSSRDGETNEFNLFPWKKRCHNAWHDIFLNMTIWEVREALEDIYEEIFHTDKERVNRHWLSVCRLKKEMELKAQVERVYGIEYLQEKWITAFGGDDIKQAEKLLEYMMLFIIFGSHMEDTDYLFNNGNLTEFFEKYPANEDRLKAFNVCFGEFADWQRIKAKLSKILRQHRP